MVELIIHLWGCFRYTLSLAASLRYLDTHTRKLTIFHNNHTLLVDLFTVLPGHICSSCLDQLYFLNEFREKTYSSKHKKYYSIAAYLENCYTLEQMIWGKGMIEVLGISWLNSLLDITARVYLLCSSRIVGFETISCICSLWILCCMLCSSLKLYRAIPLMKNIDCGLAF